MILCPLQGTPGKEWYISQGFYARPSYYKKYGLNSHGGIDFAPMIRNDPAMFIIRAAHEGYVHQKNFGKAGYGRHIILNSSASDQNGQHMLTTYAHLSHFLVDDGGYVPAGDPIAVMGGQKGVDGSGDSTAKHLHFDYAKCDSNGNVLNYNNGWHGRLDVAKYIVLWSGTLTI